MNSKIAIVGKGFNALNATISEITKKLAVNDIKIITVDEARDMLEATSFNPTNEPYILHKLPEINPYPQEKQFVCKGLHQYRNINEKWICQCGKKL